MLTPKTVSTRDLITKSDLPASDFVINPYVGCPHKCLYCYAAFMKRFTHHPEPWGDFLDIKTCGRPLNVRKLVGKSVLLSSVTDCYNGFEGKYKATRRILEQLVGVPTELSILTKSSLVVRDLDLLAKMSNVSVAFSMNTLDDRLRAGIEPFASSVQARVGALRQVKEAGIKTSVFVSPIFPALTDYRALIEATRDYAGDFWFENLNLYGSARGPVLEYIGANYPHLAPLYDRIYVGKDPGFWPKLEQEIEAWCKKNRIAHKMYFYHSQIKKR
ncbi:radical SAM mobile pair protein B [Alphaproteobacteria bacterium]|nr:radical SAM mobile pair protein B [Alphaproteobacteria bacterium]